MKKAIILSVVFLGGLSVQTFLSAKQRRESEEGLRKFYSVFRIKKDERYLTRHMSNVQNPLFNTNEEGFRDNLSFKQKISENCGSPVIVFMGGSAVFGLKLRYPETVGHVLQEEMRLAGTPARVFNLGQLGHSVIQGKRLALDLFPELRPDLIVLNYGHYDMMPSATGETIQEILEGTPPGLPDLFLRRMKSYILNFFSLTGHHPPNVSIDEYWESIQKIASTGKKYDAISILLPTVTSTKYKNESFNFNRDMMNWMQSFNARSFSPESRIIFPESLSDFTREEYFAADGAHYSAEGVKALVKRLVPDLIKALKDKKLNHVCGQKSG